MSFARENILQKIELALKGSMKKPYPQIDPSASVFLQDTGDLEVLFANRFALLEGNLILCRGRKELVYNLKRLIAEKRWNRIFCQTPGILQYLPPDAFPLASGSDEADAGITDCECLVARTGTIVLSASQPSGRRMPVHVPVHVIIASRADLVPDVNDAILRIQNKYKDLFPSAVFFISGASRTADIEKKLILGVHGPREIYLFLKEGNEYDE